MKRNSLLCATAASALLLVVSSPSAQAADTPETPAAVGSMSAQDIVGAAPHVNPLKGPTAAAAVAKAMPLDPLSPGTKPGSNVGPSGGVSSQAYGTFGIPYTSKRVSHFGPGGTMNVGPNFLSTTYPYRAIGKLTFTNYSGGASFCSASLIRRSVLVTAAHCVSRFGDARLYTNFRFTPGTYAPAGATAAQIRPYGVWTMPILVRPASWRLGTDTGSGAARNNDLAVFIVARSGASFIGDRVGWFGYGWNNPSFVTSAKTGNLPVAAMSTLGYPGLMDAGRIMQRADGPTYLTTVSAARQYWQGNNFTGGSSGGPWIVNFGAQDPVLSGGAAIGTHAGQWIVGVTSWGSSDPNTPKDNYSSRFGQNTQYPAANYGGRGAGNIASLLTTLCNAIVPGTAQTYAAQGYCN